LTGQRPGSGHTPRGWGSPRLPHKGCILTPPPVSGLGQSRSAAVPSRSTSAREWVSKYWCSVAYSVQLRLGTAALRWWCRDTPPHKHAWNFILITRGGMISYLHRCPQRALKRRSPICRACCRSLWRRRVSSSPTLACLTMNYETAL
jgi:hypothetical protein